MPHYEDKTDGEKIEKEIVNNLKNEDKARDVVKLIANLCTTTDIKPDPMSQWLKLINENGFWAKKWSSSEDLIEIYPSGTKGIGKDDRLKFQVGKTQVKVVQAYESEH
jgi:hypothetical protein